MSKLFSIYLCKRKDLKKCTCPKEKKKSSQWTSVFLVLLKRKKCFDVRTTKAFQATASRKFRSCTMKKERDSPSKLDSPTLSSSPIGTPTDFNFKWQEPTKLWFKLKKYGAVCDKSGVRDQSRARLVPTILADFQAEFDCNETVGVNKWKVHRKRIWLRDKLCTDNCGENSNRIR